MSLQEQLKAVCVLGPIVFLLALGVWLTLRSGVVSVSHGQGFRQMAANMTQTFLMVLICLIAMLFIQQLIGYRFALPW